MLLIWILFWFYLNFFQATKYSRLYFLFPMKSFILSFKPVAPPTFLAAGTGFMEDSFSMDQGEGGWFQDDYIFLLHINKMRPTLTCKWPALGPLVCITARTGILISLIPHFVLFSLYHMAFLSHKLLSLSNDTEERNTSLCGLLFIILIMIKLGFLGGTVVKNLPANTWDEDLIPGLGRSSGEGNGNPF